MWRGAARDPYRRNSAARFTFWTVTLGGALGLMTWQFGWLDPPRTQNSLPATAQDSPTAEGDGENDATAPARTSSEDAEFDPVIFTEQSEPPVRSAPPDSDDPAAEEDRPVAPEALLARARPTGSSPFSGPRRPTENSSIVTADAKGRSPARRPQGNSDPDSRTASRGIQQIDGETSRRSNRASSPAAELPELDEIDRLMDAGEYRRAHKKLSRIYWNRPELRDAISNRIEITARSIYFAPQPHYMEPYVVQSGDQLRKIAEQYKVPWKYLEQLNRIDARRIRPGQKLKVIKGPFSAVVDLSDFELTVHHHGYYVRRYPVGIGKNNSTPVGKFTVLNKVVDPQYTDPEGQVVAADDPENPLGERWIDLGDGYGIHGTIDPESIGTAASRGCIRLHNDDIAEVYNLLTVGSEVTIHR